MSELINTNGVQYNNNYYKSSVGYKCCTTVEHNIILCHNCNMQDTTIDIPQVDSNCHKLMMHLYNNDTLVNLCNVSQIELRFECGNKIIIGDYRRLAIVNCCKGLISYILDSDTTSNLGLNAIKVTLTIGTGTITFDGTYNVVPNVQTETSTVVLPDTCRNSEYVYGPHCRHTLSVTNYNSSDSDTDSGCNCDGNCNCNCCPINPDDTDADTITNRELYFMMSRHINNSSLHLDSRRLNTLNSAFKTVETYQDLLKEINCSCSPDSTIVNGRLYKVNNVDGEIKYYTWDAANIRFNETTFGSKGEPGRDANDIVWSETGFEGNVKTAVGNINIDDDISQMTITQIIAKMLGLQKSVPIPVIDSKDYTYSHSDTIAITYPILNLLNDLEFTVDTNKISLESTNTFNYNILFDDVSNAIIITLFNLVANSDIVINFNEGVVIQKGNTSYGYSDTEAKSVSTISNVHIS